MNPAPASRYFPCLWLLLLFLFAGGVAGAQQTGAGSDSFTQSTWSWALEILDAQGLGPDRSGLAASLPLLLLPLLEGAESRTFSPEERARLAGNFWQRRKQQLESEVQRLWRLRDEAFFGNFTDTERRNRENNLSSARRNLEEWENRNPDSIQVPGQMALEFRPGTQGQLRAPSSLAPRSTQAPAGGSSGSLGSGGSTSPGGASGNSQTPDLLFRGRLSQVQEYLLLHLEAYSPSLDRVLARWEDFGTPEDLQESLVRAAGPLREALLGRPWAALDLRVEPPEARILVRGAGAGRGSLNLVDLVPGTYEIRVSAPGYQTILGPVELPPGEVLGLQWQLEAEQESPALVTSDPPGADVYLGSLWRGQTPLELPLTGETGLLELRLPGYERKTLTWIPGQNRDLQLSLDPLVEGAPSVQDGKDDFYWSLAAFTLTLYSSVLMEGVARDFADANSRYEQIALNLFGTPEAITPEWRSRLNTSYTFQEISRYTQYGLLAVSGALFGWMLWELFEYIRLGESSIF